MEELDPGDDEEEYWKMEVFQNHSKSYESNGKLSWIWRKGVNLGKKMVLTGVVVSSASLVLPPLVALSAIGVAFSVPAGFVIATYACGEKLLNIILPMPLSYSLEDNGTICCDEERYRIYLDNVDKGYEETGDLEVEEQEYEEDIKKGLEMRIELVDENDRDGNDYEKTPVDEDELDKWSSEESEIVEEEYEENIGDVADEEQAVDSKATHEILEGIIEAENEISSSSPLEDSGTICCDEEEYKGYEESGDLEVEEQELGEDINEGFEMRIELVDENYRDSNYFEQTHVDMDELERLPEVSEIVEEEYEENVGDNVADEEQAVDSKATHEILEGIIEAENEISSTEKEDNGMTRVSEIVEEGYEEDVGEYIADEEQPLDSKAIPEILEVIKEVESDMGLMEKEEDGVLRVIELDGEGYEEDVGEYMVDEKLLESNAIQEILGGIIEEDDNGVERVSEIVEERFEENVSEYIADEEQPFDSKAIPEVLEGVREENATNLMEKEEGGISKVIEIDGEGYEEDVGEYMADEEQPLDSRATPEILEGMKKVENEIFLLEKEEDEMLQDLSREFAIANQLDGENEIDVELVTDGMVFVPPRDITEENELAGLEGDKLRIETTMQLNEDTGNKDNYGRKREGSLLEETAEENEESRIVPVEDMSEDKEPKNLTVTKEDELATDDKGVTIGLKSESNVEQVKEDMASVSPRNLKEENGFAGIEEGSSENMRDEGKADLKREDSPAKETMEGNEELGIVSVNDMLHDKGNKNLTILEEVVPAMDDREVSDGLTGEHNVEQKTEDMAFVSTMDIGEVNGFADVEEEELKRETTGLIEKMRDEGKADEKRKDNIEKETPQGDEESERVLLKSVSQDEENKNLTLIPEGLEPAIDEKGSIVDLKNDVFLGSTSNEGFESKSAVEDQTEVNVKVDGDHSVTEVHSGTGSDKVGTLILSEEDTTEEAVESVFDLSDNEIVAPHHIANSLDILPEGCAGEGQSSTNMVEVAVDCHEVAIESTTPVPDLLGEDQFSNKVVEISSDYHEVATESTLPLSEHSETVLDQGTTAGSVKVKPDVEKVWEQINAMRTIVGYAYTPHLTCAEELKALYNFTGIELPTSSNDPSDLADINEKLHFLMSIIGVK